ncbi:phage terminase small subunit P27 family [Clostridium perfringens]
MARAPKPVALQTAKMSKEEREIRQEAEDRLKGDDSKVYEVPPGLNKKVAEIYMAIVNELKHANILNNLDVDLVSTTADAIYRLRNARRNLDRMGEVIMDHNGRLVKSPWVQVTKDYQGIFHAGVRELGLSPSSRAKLAMYQVEANAEVSEEDELFDNI